MDVSSVYNFDFIGQMELAMTIDTPAAQYF
jgi:hypothetical protein